MSSIKTVAVVGAGTMGAGIAQTVALAGMTARLHDSDARALSSGLARALALIDGGLERGKITAQEGDKARAALCALPDLEEAVSGADLVIEAVPERMDLKRETFERLSRLCPASAILASNTSSLSVTEIASSVPAPSRVVGLHFFNPPHLMKLVEIIRAEQTSDETLETSRRFVAALGKEAIVVRDSPGFATSRLGLALGLEAMRMVEQGVASATDIDRAMVLGYGHPMGPLQVSDLVGLDVRLGIAEILQRELGDRFQPPFILRRMVRAGKLGRKSGEGFYRWDSAGKRRD
ncbi:MAG TPA: 3-hydroxyacyl-CoA dehydrogenase family protein [Candidatus Polarisedimenticolia bacterium]|nr:3-hydroxyacyl-CoA dehydrogenase family protein [Candidatus Polarisedimenticolia bacterium]